eukprot:gene4269-4521_t
MPAIDAKTMTFHYGTHYAAYVNNTNSALAQAASSEITDKSNLTGLIMNIAKLPPALRTAIRNQGGGAWNHALYFRHLTSPTASSKDKASKGLSDAVWSSFGSWDKMITDMTTAGTRVFGSGWSWLCYLGDGRLGVTITPNQDNPLMGSLSGAYPVKYAGCTPILGLDVWEHSYYLKHGPKRADYIKDFFTAVDWAQVSKNYDNAKAGKAEEMVKP